MSAQAVRSRFSTPDGRVLLRESAGAGCCAIRGEDEPEIARIRSVHAAGRVAETSSTRRDLLADGQHAVRQRGVPRDAELGAIDDGPSPDRPRRSLPYGSPPVPEIEASISMGLVTPRSLELAGDAQPAVAEILDPGRAEAALRVVGGVEEVGRLQVAVQRAVDGLDARGLDRALDGGDGAAIGRDRAGDVLEGAAEGRDAEVLDLEPDGRLFDIGSDQVPVATEVSVKDMMVFSPRYLTAQQLHAQLDL